MNRGIRAYTFDVILTTRTRNAVARAAALAAATGCGALALASPAAAEKLDQHLAVDCPQPYSQTCPPRQGLSVTTSGGTFLVTFTADGNPPSCAPGLAKIYIDGRQWDSPVRLDPGQSTHHNAISATPGTHQVEVQMDGVLGGCNTGSMSGWSGNLHVDTDNDAREIMNPASQPDSRVPPWSPSPAPPPSQPPANSCDPRVDICVH
jgi:hypothetical protein